MPSLLAFAFAACSAIACYAGSSHCMWPALCGHPRMARLAGIVLALLSAATWINVLGAAAGLCAMLASWMLMLVAQPWLALFMGNPDADVTEKD